jgi:opacity protein-like surface antigen
MAGGFALVALASVQSVSAQAMTEPKLALELRGSAVVPTFDIADAADIGLGFGAGIGYRVAEKVSLMADFDMGMHPTPTPDFNINTLHYMAKVGYDVFVGDRVTVTANLGAGIVQFGGDLPETRTYPAINAGAKIAVALSDAVDLLISPQGDIAFTKEAELGTTNAWVWPFGAGLRFKF